MTPWLRRLSVAALLAASPSLAQSARAGQEEELFELDEVLRTETHVASLQERAFRESPGVVTLITREELIASGARDLMDVLALVPGFWFGTDVQGVTDVGFRGLWAHEGKMLLMVDGVPMNELAFNTNQLGHHYPVEQLQQVEIIRGPGSAIYGGMAELCVINLITRDAKALHGSAVAVSYGQMNRTFGHADLHLATGQESAGGVEGLNVTAAASVGRGVRSGAVYSDFSGNRYGMNANSELMPTFVDLGVDFKKLSVRLLHDHYTMTERDSFGTALPFATDQSFTTTAVDAAYVFTADRLTLTPRVTYTLQSPWDVTNPAVPDYQDITVSRLSARVVAAYRLLDGLELMLGTEDYTESTRLNHPDVSPHNFFFGPNHDQQSIAYWNLAGFSEVTWDSSLGHLTVGARLERHSAVGNSFVPRAAFTRVFGDFNLKLLYSYAFRAPGVEPINEEPVGVRLKPERTRDAEVEVGYRASRNLFLSANVFDVTVKDVVVYSAFGSASAYQNFPQTGSQGFELQSKLVSSWGYLNANYSFYTARSIFDGSGKNQVSLFAVPGSNTLLAGFPAHKVTVSGKVKLGYGLSVAPSVVVLSARLGQTDGDGAGNGLFGRQPPLALLNVMVTRESLFMKNLDLSVGVFNLVNTSYGYLQPYSSGHAPLPGPTREFVARLALAL